jgi:hypothetical protein
MNGFPGLRRFPTWALLAPLLFWASPALSAERIAVRQVLDTSSLGSPFVYDVSPDGAVLVLTGDNLFDAGSGKNLFGEPLKDPAWFAFAGGTCGSWSAAFSTPSTAGCREGSWTFR